ncbi:MAG: AroM family protein [Sulfolobales archaeon]
MKKIIGAITIGQSPRTDVIPELTKVINREDIEIIERGALDDMDKQYIETHLRPDPGDTVYVTRLRDGSQVKISKKKLLPLVEKRIRELEDKVDIIALLCSGEFPDYESKKPIVYPDKVLKGFASSISFKGRVAVLIPAEEQVDYGYKKWSAYFKDLVVIPISPYTSSLSDFERVGERIKREGTGLIIMDCIGYSEAQRDVLARSIGNIRIITTRRALARVLSELV